MKAFWMCLGASTLCVSVFGWSESRLGFSGVAKSVVATTNGVFISGSSHTAFPRTVRYLSALDRRTGALSEPFFFPGFDGPVYSLASEENYLYVLGDFTKFSGKTQRRLAKIDLRTGKPVEVFRTPELGFPFEGSRVLVHGDAVFVAGSDRTQESSPRPALLEFDATTGALRRDLRSLFQESGNSPMKGNIVDLQWKDHALYIGGDFYLSNVDGFPLLKIDMHSVKLDLEFHAAVRATLVALCPYGSPSATAGRIAVSADGVLIAGTACDIDHPIAAFRVNGAGELDTVFSPLAEGLATDLVVAQDAVYVSGIFGIRKLDRITGQPDPRFKSPSGVGSEALFLVADQDQIYLFGNVDGRRHVIALSPTTGEVSQGFSDPDFHDGQCFTAVTYQGRVLCGGTMESYGGIDSKPLLKLLPGSLEPDFKFSAPLRAAGCRIATTLLNTPDWLYVGCSLLGRERGLFKVDPRTGVVDPDFHPVFRALSNRPSINALAEFGGAIYAAGDDIAIPTTAGVQKGLFKFNAETGELDLTFRPRFPSDSLYILRAYQLIATSNAIWFLHKVYGATIHYDGVPVCGFVSLDPETAALTPDFSPNCAMDSDFVRDGVLTPSGFFLAGSFYDHLAADPVPIVQVDLRTGRFTHRFPFLGKGDAFTIRANKDSLFFGGHSLKLRLPGSDDWTKRSLVRIDLKNDQWVPSFLDAIDPDVELRSVAEIELNGHELLATGKISRSQSLGGSCFLRMKLQP